MNLSFQEVQTPIETGVSRRQKMLEDQEQEEYPEEVKVPKNNDWEKSQMQRSLLHSRNLFKDVIEDDKLSSSHHELPQQYHADVSETSHFDTSPPVDRLGLKKKKPSSTFKVITKEIKKEESKKPKKRLMTIKDLENMTFTEIKKLPIYNYGGDLYQKALEMAEQAEQEERIREANACKIRMVEFVINYATNFGEVIVLTGDAIKLGKWTYKGLPLVWSEGHFWHTSIEADELPLHFEYKFIVVDGERVGRWEKGQNRVFDYDDLSEQIKETKKNQPAYLKGNALLEIKTHTIGKESKVVFDERQGLLTIRNLWSRQ